MTAFRESSTSSTLLLDAMRGSKDSRAFQETAWQFRRVINEEYAGPRLQAAIRASQTFMPRAFWMSYLNNHDEMLPFYEAEAAAIRRRDPEGPRGVRRAVRGDGQDHARRVGPPPGLLLPAACRRPLGAPVAF